MSNVRLPPLRDLPPADPTPLQGIPPPSQMWGRLPDYAADALRHFTQRPSIEFVKEIGDPGVQGGCWLFTERRNGGAEYAGQFIVKWYNAYNDYGHSVSEYRVLSLLSGPEHIAQLKGTGYFQSGMGRGLILEYVAHGSLWDLACRFMDSGRLVPERLAWRIFLCLTRACAAMRWLPLNPRSSYKEGAPPLGVSANINIRHGDMHACNVLVGGLDATDEEHRISPIIKLIDFGLASIEDVTAPIALLNANGIYAPTREEVIAAEATPASQANIHDIGALMQVLLTGAQYIPGDDPDQCVVDGVEFETNANMRQWQGLLVTDDLEDLVYRCMATDPDYRPAPRELLTMCENAVQNWSPADFELLPNGAAIYETDAVIQQYIQSLVLNADYDRQQDRLRQGRRRTFIF